MANLKKNILKLYNKLNDFVQNKLLNTRKSSVLFLTLLVFVTLFIIQIAVIIFNSSVYNNSSDDIIQYYVIVEGFIRSVKEGSISFFDLNNYFGASIFSNLYYVPLDVFTLLTLLLSFVMPTLVAVSSTELIKIVVGVMLLGIYLSLKKYKPKTIFWVGILYFVSGGSVSFMNFPAFLSMTVYLPLGLIVIHYFFKKKYWILPLFVLAIVLYNFYLAYMILAFISFAFIIEYFKYHDFNLKSFLLNGSGFLALILLGVVMSSFVLLPAISFISEETIRADVGNFEPWVLNLKFIELRLFQPEVYIRYFAKLYSPQRPVSFRGFLGDYKLEHVSNYVSIIGFMLMLLVFFIKGKIARVYKIMFAFIGLFILLPFFSSVLSGTYVMQLFSNDGQEAFPYNRWINMIPLLQILVIAFVIENYEFKPLKRWPIFLISIPLLALGIRLVVYYTKQLKANALLAEGSAGKLSGFTFESLTYDKVFMIVSLSILFIALMIVFFKKVNFLKPLIFLEVSIAVAYIFASTFGSINKLDSFKDINNINDYINESVETDIFSRVYVDFASLKVEDRNFNQMTTLPTNTRIFHSWSDAETDDLGYLMFGSIERQGKLKMNYYSYYLSTFLGYKYILTDAKSNSIDQSNDFTLVSRNDKYALYKILPTDGFYVYDKYMTYDNFRNFVKDKNNAQIAAERIFLKGIILDQDRYDIDIFDLEELLDSDIEYKPTEGNIVPYSVLNTAILVKRNKFNDEVNQSKYFLYDDLDIDYSSGEIILKDTSGNLPSHYGEVFYQNSKGEEKLCKISELNRGGTQRTIIQCGQFFHPIEKIFVEENDEISSNPRYLKRLERAINRSSHLVYDLSLMNQDLLQGLLDFSLNNYEMKNNFAIDEDGNSIYSFNGLFSTDSKLQTLYIEKTPELYKHGDLFSLMLDYVEIDLIDDNLMYDEDIVDEKLINIDHGKINLSYKYLSTSTKNNIIAIPITYSDDWQFTSEQKYDKISVSGGFLGIVIPEGTDEVDISLEFVPKNLGLGIKISCIGGLVYFTLIALPWLMKKCKWRVLKK